MPASCGVVYAYRADTPPKLVTTDSVWRMSVNGQRRFESSRILGIRLLFGRLPHSFGTKTPRRRPVDTPSLPPIDS